MSTFSVCKRRFAMQEEYLGYDKPVNKFLPLLSVTVTAYQHGPYIRRCLDGLLGQTTSFHYEIILGEDGSTDGTREICTAYAERFPDRIRLFLRDRQLSQYTVFGGGTSRFNGIWTRMSARGKYVAYCEGDDYWIDPMKLQKQVDFLEHNTDFGVVFSDADYLFECDDSYVRAYDRTFGIQPLIGDCIDLMLSGHAPYKSCTAVYRRELTRDADEIMCRHMFKRGDAVLWLSIAGQSRVGYLPEPTSVYRIRRSSASNFSTPLDMIRFHRGGYALRVYFANFLRRPLNRDRLRDSYRRAILAACLRNGWIRHAMKYLGCGPFALRLFWSEIYRRIIARSVSNHSTCSTEMESHAIPRRG